MRIRLFTPLALLLILALLPTGSALSASGHPGGLADMSARPSAHPLTHVVTSDTSGRADQGPMPDLSWTCYSEAGYPLGICGDIVSIALRDADDGWAVMGGTLLRLSGGTWSAVTNPAGGWFGPINSIALAGSNRGWAVGEQSTLMRLSGETWSVVTSPAAEGVYLKSVALGGPNDGWAVGDTGTILPLRGGRWSV